MMTFNFRIYDLNMSRGLSASDAYTELFYQGLQDTHATEIKTHSITRSEPLLRVLLRCGKLLMTYW